jgi:tRNA dimethylallyltransferase
MFGMTDQETPLLVVTGPTASGKTDSALSLAEELGGEIVSCDSVQVYKGCVIGSNAPSQVELNRIVHHGIAILDPSFVVNAGWFVRFALEKIHEVASRGKLPIICGGTTMWLTSLLSGLTALPQRNDELRRSFSTKSSEELYELLMSIDPERAVALHPNDRLRVERAIEIKQAPLAERVSPKEVKFCGRALILIKSPTREDLYDRINRRTREMFRNGFVEEVEFLLKNHADTAPVFSTIGYSSIVSWIKNGGGASQRDTLVDEVAQATRNYAKRQMTFFRNEPSKRGWIAMEDERDISNIRSKLEVLKSKTSPGERYYVSIK